jgi:hypothetical protein
MGIVEQAVGTTAFTTAPSIQRHNLALQRLDAKKEIIGQIIDGRLRLLEAASRFRRLSRPTTGGAGIVAARNDSDEDLCRSLIGWVYLALSERPERAEALSDQLEAELAAHLKQHGSVNLAK